MPVTDAPMRRKSISPAAIMSAIMPPIEWPTRNTLSASTARAACPITSASSRACRSNVLSAGSGVKLAP